MKIEIFYKAFPKIEQTQLGNHMIKTGFLSFPYSPIGITYPIIGSQ